MLGLVGAARDVLYESESYTRILRHGLLLVWQQGAGARHRDERAAA